MDLSEADVIATLAHELHAQDTVQETVEVLVESAPSVVGSNAAGIVLALGERRWETGPAFGPGAIDADELHVKVGEGPAISAMQSGRTIVANHLATDGRWPEWSPAARNLGIASVLSVRLWASTRTMGAISFYSLRTDTFDDESVGIGEILARHASIAVASARHEESLTRAIDARKLVGQAQGILMERFGLDDRRAFDVLRRISQHTNTKLNEVARTLVTTRDLPGDPSRRRGTSG